MEQQNDSPRRLNLYIFLAIILGLMVIILTVLPNFVSPTLVRRQTSLQLLPDTAEISTPGPTAPTSTPTPASRLQPNAGCRRYTVQSGDTLFALAHRAGTTEAAIALANNLHVDILTVGQVLVICGLERANQSPAPERSRRPAPVTLNEPVDVVMHLTYPAVLHNRTPQWITLSMTALQSPGVAGVGLLPDVVEATTLQPFVLPVPQHPRLPQDQTAALVEHWISATLTGTAISLRSRPMQESQALSVMLTEQEPITWQWLFAPASAGDYLFGLDLFSSGEFELLDATGNMIGTARTNARPVWSHEFAVSVDEIFGIPRRWWVLASGVGSLLNLFLGLIQIAGSGQNTQAASTST